MMASHRPLPSAALAALCLAFLHPVSADCGAFYRCTRLAGCSGCAPLWNSSHILCSDCSASACPAAVPPGWPPLDGGCDTDDEPTRDNDDELPTSPALNHTVVFKPGLAGVTCYRIPSIVQLGSGALVAFAEARRGSCSDAAAREIATRVSLDGGASWGEVGFAIGNHDEGEDALYAGNPAAVVLADGVTIVLAVALHTPRCGGNCVSGNAVTMSVDGGASWSWSEVMMLSSEGRARTGPGLGLLLALEREPGRSAPDSAGRVDAARHRLLVPGSTGTYTADHVYLSDDGGLSWRVAADDSSLAGHHLDEAQLTQLPNGTAIIMMRHPDEAWKGKALASSHDGGETWGRVTYLPQLFGPVCQSSIVTFGGATYYSGPASNSHQRVLMTIRRSDDSARTFPTSLLVDGGASGYSCLVPAALRKGRPEEGGLLYEGAGGELRFVRFPLDLEAAGA